MAKITYTNKVTLNPQPSIADENKVTSGDMNEIKSSVNTLYDNQGDLSSLQTTTKSSLVGAVNELKSGEVYSSSEIKTNEVWIDGKPIYRQVIDITSYYPNGISAGSQVTFKHVISNFDALTNTRIIRTGTNPLEHKSLSYIQYITDNSRNEFNIYAGNLGIGKTSGQSFYLIVEYTKTTD